ncbi:MAG: DegT/DnrJ/EryC1/StrS family aminotransferase [Bacteroidales bacterium]|nr:DegT/DnrJ/EryC1/StrS family aminotransferase [Bacteroidales bacterium]MCM1414536.1 DegT/DnrJ/EryC1/StrS family aminotransferase [bacterium]MCM1422586.1 DegT/DnrJ/EryC1/StrS family aminotransferase [bacterium]
MEFIDLKAQYRAFKSEIDQNIDRVLENADFILGDQAAEFEEKLAAYVGVKYAVGCSSGTDALQLIYMAYGIGRGDAVFCPDMTFVASVEPAFMLGAEPVFCDIEKDSYNICPDSLERQIKAVLAKGERKPKAVVAVDFIGNPADYDRLRRITDRYGLLLIEDAAQGTGASYHGRKCGSLGDIGATSFFPSKPLGCYGDGGAVYTDSEEMRDLLKSLRVHGKGSSKYDNIRVGMNARLDTIQAAVMLPKLAHLEEEIAKRQKIAARYDVALRDRFVVPAVRENTVSSYAQYALLAENAQHRDEIREKLKEQGIPTIVYYPNPMHRMKVFADCFAGDETFENTADYADRTFSLPFSAYLTKDDQERIIEALLHI